MNRSDRSPRSPAQRIGRVAILLALAGALLSGCTDGKAPPEPTLDITFPTPGSIHRTARFNVEGTATNIDRVEVNGVSAEVVGGAWRALVPFEQGEVTAVVTGGGKEAEVAFTVDSVLPQLTVTSPTRASYHDAANGDEITVQGTVSDVGTGLNYLTVDGAVAEVDAAGNFSVTRTMTPGTNTFRVVARDHAGNETDDIRAVMYGEYIAPDATIDPAFDIWVDQTSMPVLQEVVEGFVTPENLTVMLGAFQSNAIEITSIDLAPVDATFSLRRGAIDVSLRVTDLAVQGNFKVGSDTHNARIDIRELTISLSLTPFATPDGELDVLFTDPVLDLNRDNLSYQIADLSDDDSEFLEDLVIDMATAGFGYVMSLGLVDTLYDPEMLKRNVTLLGREIAFHVAFSEIDIFPDGIAVRTTVSMPVEKFPEVRDAPGALNRTTSPPTNYESTGDLAFSLTENTLDRILHGAWNSGLLHYQLDSAAFAGFNLPIELTAGALATALDAQISAVAGPTAPAALRLRPQFPPVAKFDPEQRLVVEMPEAHIDVLLLPPGEAPVVLATVAAFLELGVSVAITDGVAVQLSFDTSLEADVADEPLVDLDDERTESLLEGIIAMIPELLAANLDVRGEADVTWVTLNNPSIGVHGAQFDRATVNLGMVANPVALDTSPFAPTDP